MDAGSETGGKGADTGRTPAGFFSDAMKEMITPFAGLIEKRLQPLLNAIEAIPTQAEKWGEIDVEKAGRKALGGALDQLHARLPGGKTVSLPMGEGEKKKKRDRRFLRPPGAMVGIGAEGANDFESVCSRCGMCVEACPASAIKLDSNGLAAGGFPYIVAEEQPCVVCDELACMKSCPTGALKLVDRLEILMGTAKVDHATCLRDRGEPCTLCVDACPVMGGKDGDMKAIIASATSGKIIVRKNICIGCGLCEAACPTEPRSVKVIPFERGVEPIVA